MNIQHKQPFILVIYGPTGVGKSDLALAIAEKMPAEIINIDVGQFYKPLSIGTAKPDWRNSPVPHHLFDIIDKPINITVIKYRQLLIQTVNDIIARGKLPIVVGGSGFYLRSFLFPVQQDLQKSHSVSYNRPCQNLWQELYAIDPERALSISKTDTYRVVRALEIWHASGKKPTEYIPHYDPFSDYVLLYVGRDVADLNNRINQRVIQMVQHGWIEEVKTLSAEWRSFIKNKKIIGYNEILDFLQGNQDKKSFDHMVEIIGNKTRQYAKRQRTFWKKLEREIARQCSYQGNFIGCVESINLTNIDIHLYINELLKQLSLHG